jgi:nitroreductase
MIRNQERSFPKEVFMKRRSFVKDGITAVPALAVFGLTGLPGEGGSVGFGGPRGDREAMRAGRSALEPIVLPKPEKDGGKSVLASLWARKTDRNIKPDPLPPQVLSNLLWAAFGVNRPEGLMRGKPGRTAASASNSQEIDLYVALPEGVYLYESGPHRLAPVAEGDLRARAGRGKAGQAPVNIFFVVDLSRYVVEGQPDRRISEPEVQKSYYFTATGLIASNIYLFAASQGLAAWFHNCDRENAAKDLKLRPEQRVLFAQTVGYPEQA